ncbi:transglycosylase SLT domain-containing protein [Flavobacterium sp. MXW15]|nr:transglycosylase SLT domain-containing protein [Flavobacterium sp. MXW15]
MLPGLELAACTDLAVPLDVMRHVVKVESSFNPYAIGVVGGRLVRQPDNLPEALSTVRMLEEKGYNFSLGLAQVNRYNLQRYGLATYEQAFEVCPNLVAGSRILAECYGRAGGDWGKSFSCYYSGNFTTGFRHGYVQKVYASISNGAAEIAASDVAPIAVVENTGRKKVEASTFPAQGRRDVVTSRMGVDRPQRHSSAQETPMVGFGNDDEPARAVPASRPAGAAVQATVPVPAIDDPRMQPAVPTVSVAGAHPASIAPAAGAPSAQVRVQAPNHDSAFVF